MEYGCFVRVVCVTLKYKGGRVDESIALFNSTGTYRKTQTSKLIHMLSLQSVDLQEPYVALVDMGMIWSIATPTAEDLQTTNGTHTNGRTTCTMCHRLSLSASILKTTSETRVYRVRHIYMKLVDPFPCAKAFKTLVCSVSNKGRQ